MSLRLGFGGGAVGLLCPVGLLGQLLCLVQHANQRRIDITFRARVED